MSKASENPPNARWRLRPRHLPDFGALCVEKLCDSIAVGGIGSINGVCFARVS